MKTVRTVSTSSIPEEVWRRARGNQLFRSRRFVETGCERQRLINLGFITPKKK